MKGRGMTVKNILLFLIVFLAIGGMFYFLDSGELGNSISQICEEKKK